MREIQYSRGVEPPRNTDSTESSSQLSPGPTVTQSVSRLCRVRLLLTPRLKRWLDQVLKSQCCFSLDVVLLIKTLKPTRNQSASEIVKNAFRSYIGDLLSINAFPVETYTSVGEVVDCTLRLSSELVQICDTQADSIPVRTILEGAIQYEYVEHADTVTVEFHSRAVDDIPRDTAAIFTSLFESLLEASSFSID